MPTDLKSALADSLYVSSGTASQRWADMAADLALEAIKEAGWEIVPREGQQKDYAGPLAAAIVKLEERERVLVEIETLARTAVMERREDLCEEAH